MIIDVHGHAGPWFFSTDVGSVELNLALMDRYGIDRQIVSASEAVTYDVVSGNRWLAEVLDAHPRLLGYVVVNPNDLGGAARELEKYRPAGRFVGVKVHTTYPDRPLLSAEVRDALGLAAEAGLPALVHTWDDAGLSTRGPVLDGDPALFRTLIDLNVNALTELTTLLMPAMVARGHGAVVNIASTGGYIPAPYLAVYAATKAYVVSLTQALWAETRGTGVRVVAVSPGPTKTPMNPRGTRSAEAVAATVARALSGNGPAVIDGKANALTAFLFGRLLPTRFTLAVARRVMARSGD
ncbi:SDR family NAD(P)-dependent oxidoreductase [Amycolatopsis sp. NPDC021455]|uniref:SDR family NAD(P)-dependent oxidoreductase n=1 Tax=Amycolatopsis sp. NPDC021455 TaxID=3154901 RepID=UPI0033E0AEFA